ncbi:hypothetical protein [Streptomyces sp. NBC_01190]|nr:hypothetical protein OG519_01500 [Streptomyces sp. NBC_01190]
MLTAVGEELAPVLTALRVWGERHVTPASAARAGGARTDRDQALP